MINPEQLNLGYILNKQLDQKEQLNNNSIHHNPSCRIIFHIEHRGYVFLYHWLIYMLGGLYHVLSGKPLERGHGGGGFFEQNKELFLNNQNTIQKPYYICMSQTEPLFDHQIQTLEIIKKEFIYINKSEITKDDIVINNYGANILNNKYVDHSIYIFLRNLFLNNCPFKETNIPMFYIARSRSHTCAGNMQNGSTKRRHILNEQELSKELQKNNIQTLFLEDYDTDYKINLFKKAKLIISPNSAGLVFSLFCSSDVNIIEIDSLNCTHLRGQYKDICGALKIKYSLYSNVEKVDSNNNMNLNVNKFMSYLAENKYIQI